MRKLVILASSFWVKACDYDNIPRHTPVAVFGRNNPYIKAYNRTLALIIKRKSQKGS
jgi:hypothetical protein